MFTQNSIIKEDDIMSTVKVHAGVCKFETTIKVRKTGYTTCEITFESGCPSVRRMSYVLKNCTVDDVKKSFLESPIYSICANYLKHVSCPVPAAIIKAIEVAFDLALAKDVFIEIKRDEY